MASKARPPAYGSACSLTGYLQLAAYSQSGRATTRVPNRTILQDRLQMFDLAPRLETLQNGR